MSNCIAPSPDNKHCRRFSPVILFHDHRFIRDSGDLEHIHIPYRDPHYVTLIESHKKRINQMLQDNGRFWADVMMSSSKSTINAYDKPLSPVPSLVSSPPQHPPSPPLWNTSSSSSSPPPPLPLHHQHQQPSAIPTSSSPPSSSSPSSATFSFSSSSTTRYPHRPRRSSMNAMDAPPIHSHHHRRITKATSSSSSTNGAGGGGTGGNIKKRQRSNLPKPVTAILKNWLAEHKKHPYPNEDEKCQLVRQTGLARNQISNWFINARRRILRPMLEEGEEDEDEDDHLSYDDKWRSSRRGVNLT
ncbi:predicted protein [Lichtheimia corymbifera JMRC:FSU:9682]|uniref:Homeobox domain-containing protein n=1 Tax=Lichtheimia corymbifera JMRC:FSU:9682 TaxID=1263082 RepID=A0A068S6R9_9FUNG|nr:predicted protein [Lichtheimia corymbifera JMRC:FSU:9682]